MANSSPFGSGRIRYLFLFARDFKRMQAFYRDVLGLTPLYAEDGQFAFLRVGDHGPDLAIYPGRQTPDEAMPHWFWVVDVENIEASAAALSARGVAVGPIEAVPNGRAATFKDPEGNQIEIHQPTG